MLFLRSIQCCSREQTFAQRCGRRQLRLLLDERNAQAVTALDIALVEVREPRDHPQQRGFSGAIAANEPDALP